MTVPEVRRLLLTLDEPAERFGFRLAWSTFRRRHQAQAKRCHTARRAQARPPPTRIPPIQELEAGDFTLSDEQWARIALVLPPQKPPRGRPGNDHRTILAGIFWVIQTGASWREVPAQFGAWQTIHTRYQRWKRTGIWQQILHAAQQTGDVSGS